MDSVYVAEYQQDNEWGSQILGVYSTENKAKAACEEAYRVSWYGSAEKQAKSWVWTQYEVTGEWTGRPEGYTASNYQVTPTPIDEW